MRVIANRFQKSVLIRIFGAPVLEDKVFFEKNFIL